MPIPPDEIKSVKVSTFWIGVMIAIVIPALAQYITIQGEITIMAERQNAVMVKLDKMEASLAAEIVGRTDNWFTTHDWMREEERITVELAKLEQEFKTLKELFYTTWSVPPRDYWNENSKQQ